jgi:predicted GNAT family acetyltransferase
MSEIRVVDTPEHSRYEASVDGQIAGFAAYRPDRDRLVFTHTEIDPAFEGKGIGSVLAREALDDVRRKGKKIVPLCPFISAFIRKHPEYVDLVDEGQRDQFDAPST